MLEGPGGGITQRSGKRIGPLFVGPDTQWSITLLAGQKTHTTFTINVEKGPVKIERVEGGQPQFIARIETIEAGKSYKLVVETAAAEKPGGFGARLRVITDSPVLPFFQINLFVNVLPRQ